ncbi:hypothetical protein TARUN_5651 [Trichoderma arundinaceum]|uniref:Uncharacterized protein n=1 Tax=Trichoderma arundinaceum TaxID=490622 RepID=A0A395NKF4_TRIAR|nr:hypothetical protein TARUN_5651 [Trichoderma arundinaceum]
MRLAQASPLDDEAFNLSVEKSYTDCFRVQGFVGGDWGYCTNTNEVSGDPIANSKAAAPVLDPADRRLVIYVLGWESAEIHEDYVRSPIFEEEMVTLGPWADQSSGAWYTTFIKHGKE